MDKIMNILKKFRVILILLVITVVVFIEFPLGSLPLYTARSGRICDNCHTTPFKNEKQSEWPNPSLSKRKCNVSCLACHVDPEGGGMRNVVGRYYARNTLPMFNPIQRPYHDRNRDFSHLFSSSSEDKKGNQKTTEEKPGQENKEVKRHIEDYHKPKGFYGYDTFALGYPLNASTIESQSQYAFARERYGYLNADPLLSLGTDIRPTYLYREDGDKKNSYIFPMQVEFGAALHPIEHVTFNVSGSPLGLKNAFALIHELPYMIYLQGGIFLPAYGVRHDDHTAPGRYVVDMDQTESHNYAVGGQIGAAFNYPYISMSLFQNRKKFTQNEFAGLGATFNAGWRDLAWGLGVSAMVKDRDIEQGGQLKVGGVNGYFNIGRLSYDFPITFQAEVNYGEHSKTVTRITPFITTLFQIDYLLVNGLNFRLGHHFLQDDEPVSFNKPRTPDNTPIGQEPYLKFHRATFGFDYNIFYMIKLNGEVRETFSDDKGNMFDILFFFHFYI